MSDAEDDYFGTRDTISFELRHPTFIEWMQNVINNTTKGRTMTTTNDLKTRREKLAAELAEVDQRLAAREGYGEDPFRSGDMLKVMMSYSNGGGSYTYAAVKARGRFYLTGKVGVASHTSSGWTWDQFVAWLASGEAAVWRVTKLEKVL